MYVDCEATYLQRQLFNGSLVLLLPIGLPLGLLYIDIDMLWRKRDLIKQEDDETLEELDFIIGDYTTESSGTRRSSN